MVRRVLAGRSPFSSDRNHIHHRLLDLGFAHREAVILVYCVQVGLFLLAYSLRFESDLLIAATFGAFAAAVLGVLHWSRQSGWRAHTGKALPLVSALLDRLRQPETSQMIVRAATWAMGMGLISYAAVIIVASTHVGTDIGLLSGTLLLLLLFSYFATTGAVKWLERLAAYVAVILLVYLDETTAVRGPIASSIPWIVIGVTAAAAVVRFMFSATRRFEVTALDVLVAFVALVVPNLPGFLSLPPNLPAGILKAVALLYVVEMLDGAAVRQMVPRALLAVMLAAVMLRGLAGLYA